MTKIVSTQLLYIDFPPKMFAKYLIPYCSPTSDSFSLLTLSSELKSGAHTEFVIETPAGPTMVRA